MISFRNMMIVLSGVFVVAFLQGCSVDTYRAKMSRNLPLAARYAVTTGGGERTTMGFNRNTRNLYPGSNVSRSFIGLGLSGGGSRAANFSLGVMEELETMGLLEHVNVISTVSGGSLAGAYFALHSDRMNWERARVVMRKDFMGKWWTGVLRPDNLIRQFTTDLNRSDIMAAIFDEELFQGATFSALGPYGPRRPKLFINATNAAGSITGTREEGLRFVFDDQGFSWTLGSDLGRYSIAKAVMASAAFPAVFNRVTLEKFNQYMSAEDGSDMPPQSYRPPQYVHLMDGGPSDNLGVATLIEAAFSHYFREMNDGPVREPGPCLLILADAFQPIDSKGLRQESDPRGFVDRFIDTDFFDAISVLLAQRREETLTSIGIRDVLGARESKAAYAIVEVQGVGWDHIGKTRRVTSVSIPYVCGANRKICNLLPRSVGASGADNFTCLVWHLSLDDIRSSGLYHGDGTYEPSTERSNANGVLARIVEKIPTHFKLKGPRACSPELLQTALFQAASFLARDRPGTQAVCSWAHGAGLLTKARCMAPSNKGPTLHKFPVAVTSVYDPAVKYENTPPPYIPEESLALQCEQTET